MIMSIKEEGRKRRLERETDDDQPDKKIKSEGGEIHSIFTEKMYSTYIQSALESLDKNDNLQIDTLASKISLPFEHEESISIQNINIVLKCLISNISRLDNKYCNSLITALLDYKWLEYKPSSDKSYSNFIELYSHFLAVLVSSLPKYLHEVISKLVAEFVFVSVDNDECEINHHQILNKIIKFIPTCINSFPKILQKNFPHHLSSNPIELTNYVGNMLKMISYCQDLQYNIWQIIVECCIKLDVELQNELDDLDDEEIEELINGDDEESDIENEDEIAEKRLDDSVPEGEMDFLFDPVTSTSHIRGILVKLDSILKLLLNDTAKSFTVDELNNGNGVTLFNTISSLFKSHILPTHFTKLIQFILFHISQYQPELSDSFLVLLIDVAFNPSEILEKRLKAMQYLSSYISRAKNLTRHQVVFIVSYLIGWLKKYVDERECEIIDIQIKKGNNNRQIGGMERFKLFYAAFQALLYIFCFRYKMLYKDSESSQKNGDSEWESDIDKFFQRLIVAKFNPLKYCDETVVYIFAKIATKLNVCYCYSIIEHNKRERMLQTNGQTTLPSAVGNFNQKQEFLDLEAYFPFDPLVLPNSKKIINPNYIEWSEVNPSTEEDDDIDSGSHLDEDDDEDSDLDDEEITSEEDDDDEF